MLISKTSIVKSRGNNKLSYYSEVGYDTSNPTFEVIINDLLPNSSYIVEVSCDYCNDIIKTPYKRYIKNTTTSLVRKYACKGCVTDKRKESNQIKYGCDNPMQNREVLEKTKNTNLERYGVEYVLQSKVIKEKIKKTNLKNSGFENPFQSEIIKEKIKKTNLEKYGHENPFQSKVIKEKIKKTNLEKYGVEYYTQSGEFLYDKELNKEKIKKTNLEKYGGHPMSNDIIRSDFNISNDVNYLYYNSDSISTFKCHKGHTFSISSDNYSSRKWFDVNICTICQPINSSISTQEKEVFHFITSVYDGKVIENYRDGLEIDIYLPDIQIGFEYNGLYWHSEEHKSKYYHINKSEHFIERGIRIIHIWEDEWKYKSGIIKSQIKNWIGLTDFKIPGRKCSVIELKNPSDFLKHNHIQGKCPSSFNLGLKYNDELVSVMSFDRFEGRKKMLEGEWNLSRFCNRENTIVVGGFSKLLSYFIKNIHTTRIITYADKSWSNGLLYERTNFKITKILKPDYKYIQNGIRLNKTKYRKGRSTNNMSEKQYTQSHNIKKIYDCGKIKFELII